MTNDSNRADSRQGGIAERNFAETLLSCTFSVRVFSKFGNVGRGTVTISDKCGYSVHTAYIIGDNVEINREISGIVVGVLFDKADSSLALVLAAKDNPKSIWYQFEIAEAIDHWESQNSPRIYCLNEKSCGAVVFCGTTERKYVIIRMNSGHYGLPKGHVEKFETEDMTAIREVKEEIGVDISLLPDFRMPVSYSISPRVSKESVYFLGCFDGSPISIQRSEISDYRLCSFDTACRIITYDNDRTILSAAEAFLNDRFGEVQEGTDSEKTVL